MRHTTLAAPFLALSLIALCSAAFAQPVPDAGQIQRELLPGFAIPSPLAPPIGIRETTVQPADAGGPGFAVTGVLIEGHTVFSTAELLALVADLPGPARTLADAQAGAQRITAHYRSHGYPVARAYVPAQDITAGQLRIEVLEGRIDRVTLDNASRVGTSALTPALVAVQPGAVITSAPIDRALLLWTDTPGVGAARATLQPGAQVGTSQLGIEFDPAPLVQGSVALDNHGNAYTGRARLAGQLQLNSPLGLGDRLGLTALTSGRGLRHGRVAFDLPVGGAGTRLGVARHQTRYRLGGDFTALQASGVADEAQMSVSHPIWLTPTGRLSAALSAEHQSLHDRIDATSSVTDKSLRSIRATLDASWRDLQGTRLSSVNLQLVNGRLRIYSTAAAAQDAATARTQGSFTRLSWALGHLQRVGAVSQVFVAVAGQRANRNLDSAEKFAIGGPRAVRAYGSGEASGDEADLLSLEWRQTFTSSLQGVVFHDTARVRFNHTPFDAHAPRQRTLSGLGVGLNVDASWAGTPLSLQSTLAWPLKGRPAQGAPVGNPALWLTLAARF